MTIYAFDVDETLEVSGGPIRLDDLLELRCRGHVLGLCGNYAVVTARVAWWPTLFSFLGPAGLSKVDFLKQLVTYVPHHGEVVMVGNVLGVSGASDDAGAAGRAGVRFIRESDFAAGAR